MPNTQDTRRIRVLDRDAGTAAYLTKDDAWPTIVEDVVRVFARRRSLTARQAA